MTVNIKDKITTSTFRQILLVQIMSSILSLAGTMIDGIIISRFLGPVDASAYGISTPASIIMAAFAFAFSAGAAAVCGEHLGRGSFDEVNRIMNKILAVSVLTSAAFAFALSVFPYQVASLMGAEGEVLPALSDYLRTYSFSAFGMILNPVLIGFMQMDRDGNRALRASVIFLVCSTALDLFNVFVLKWGMTGMGLTTSVSYFISIGILSLHFADKNSKLKLSLKGLSLKGSGRICIIGLPSAAYHLANFVKVLVTNYTIIAIGGIGNLFTNTVLHSINPVMMGFINGSGAATVLMCSVLIGEGNRRSLHHTFKYIVRITAFIGFIVSGILFLLSGNLVSGFFCTGESAQYSEQVTTMLRMVCFFVPFGIINSVFINYFQSMKRVALANFICVMDNGVFYIGVLLLLARFTGVPGVWLTYIVTESLGIAFIFFLSFLKTKRVPHSIHDLMMLPDSFGVKADKRMNITVASTEEIPEIHEKVFDFCSKMGLETRKAGVTGLCMEELAALALANANTKKKTYVDIYLTCVDGELRLRMRNNGSPIDVSILRQDGNTTDPQENLEIKIVLGMAKEVNYSVVLGLNVFTLLI